MPQINNLIGRMRTNISALHAWHARKERHTVSFFTKQQLENYHICGFGKQNKSSNLLYLIHWCAHQSSCIFLRQHPKAISGNCKLVTTVHMFFFVFFFFSSDAFVIAKAPHYYATNRMICLQSV